MLRSQILEEPKQEPCLQQVAHPCQFILFILQTSDNNHYILKAVLTGIAHSTEQQGLHFSLFPGDPGPAAPTKEEHKQPTAHTL